MRQELKSRTVQCPYCWQDIELLVDCSVDRQTYVEDCEVCCRPILLDVQVDEDGTVTVSSAAENS